MPWITIDNVKTMNRAKMVYPLRALFVVFMTGLFAFLTIVCSPLYRWFNIEYIFPRAWARGVLKGLNIPVHLSGLEGIDWTKPVVVMTNHRSHFDTIVFIAHLPVRLHFVAKIELRRVFLLGRAMEILGMIFVDRSNPEQAKRSIELAGRQIREGKSVIIFPEGSRSHDGKTMRPFKKGGFHLALASGVPIVPMAIVGSEKVLPKGSKQIDPQAIFVRVGAPIETAKAADVDALKEETANAIQALLSKD